jgi:hypothetical protein
LTDAIMTDPNSPTTLLVNEDVSFRERESDSQEFLESRIPADDRNNLRELGTRAAQAMIQGNLQEAQAIADLYVLGHSHPSTDQQMWAADFVKNAQAELMHGQRRDLFQPLVRIIHKACLRSWRSTRVERSGWRYLNDIPLTDTNAGLPEMDQRAPREQAFAHRNQRQMSGAYALAFAGITAWDALGHALGQVNMTFMGWDGQYNNFGDSDRTKMPPRLLMYRDIVSTIPDARRWAKPLLVAFVQQGDKDPGFLEDRQVLHHLTFMATHLTDAEACSAVRNIVALTSSFRMNDRSDIIRMIVDTHPTVSLTSWMVAGLRDDLLGEGPESRRPLNALGLELDTRTSGAVVRAATDLEVVPLLTSSPRLLRRYTQVFEHIVKLVGPSATSRLPEELRGVLQSMSASQQTASDTRRVGDALQVVLDKDDLMKIAGAADNRPILMERRRPRRL